MTSGNDLPWLQDTAAHDVLTAWGATLRDVVILDPANERPVAAYNLYDHDLASEANRNELKQILLGVAVLRDNDGDKLSDYWEDEMFGGDYSQGPAANKDGDGATELLEYAHASHAGNPASLPRFEIGTLELAAERYPSITFRRRLGAAGGLSYLVEFSEGLASWATGPTEVVEVSRENPYDGTGTEIVTYRSTRPFSALAGMGYLRVRCSLP